MSGNGWLKPSELSTAQPGVLLARSTTVRYLALKAAAKKQLGRTIAIAMPAGGYRSFAVQQAMHVAGSSAGTAAQRIRWGLNPRSVVSIASAGLSSHGLGTRVDIVGTPIDTAFLNLAARYGFVREFGSADPDHFADRGTWRIPVATRVTTTLKSKKVYVTVQAGDTFSGLAERYSSSRYALSVATLQRLNPTVKPTAMRIGSKLRIA